MPWGSLIVAGGGLVANEMNQDAQEDAADKQRDLLTSQYNRNNKLTRADRRSGRAAGRELDLLMGLTPQKSYQQLKAQFAPKFTTYTETNDDSGGLGGIASSLDKLSVGNRLGLNPITAGGVLNKPGYDTNLDWKGLQDKVRATIEKQKAARADPRFGMLTKKFTNEDFIKDPGYEARLATGERAVASQANARGNFFSGRAAKELERYGQEFGSNEFGNAYNRFTNDQNNLYNRLAGIKSGSQAATSQAIQNNQNYGNNMAQNYFDAGQARATGYMNNANIASDAFSNYQMNNWLKKNPYRTTGMPDSAGSGFDSRYMV